MYKDNKGITLIALCVTIVVILILAGVVVKSLTGNNSLIEIAKGAKQNVLDEDEQGKNQREDIYNEIVSGKDDTATTGAFDIDLKLIANNTTKTISASANVTDQDIVSYTFYIKKKEYDDKAYVKINKSDKLISTVSKKVDEESVYQIKVVAINKQGKTATAVKRVVIGEVLKLNVASTTGEDSYPDVLLVSAESLEDYIDYIQMPDGTKVTASSKYELKTTYNTTKNGPITFTVKDIAGNSKTITYNEQNIPDFTTEWTTTAANTEIFIPMTGNVNVYIDYGDGTKENVTSDNPTHTYANAGTYTMKISGKCNNWGNRYVYGDAYNDYFEKCTMFLTGIKKWGCLENSYYGFYMCENIVGTIPEPHVKSFKNIINFSETFEYCSGLTGSIPENLFANCLNVTTFYKTFYWCNGLTGNIPENLFANYSNVTTFYETFYRCNGLTGSIPEKLFENCSNVTSFEGTFRNCSGLTGKIPENLFVNCPNVINFSHIFESCNNLTGSIPENLFANCKEVTGFSYAFSYCKNLTGNIPESLFFNATKASAFFAVFQGCTNLTGNIPENLFTNCINATDFGQTFFSCNTLEGNIPENLFTNCPDVTNFSGTFYDCSGLTGNIPENLFLNCPDVASFSNTFKGCSGLTGNIPERLFQNCLDVTNFSYTFKGCSGLTGCIPENLFSNCPNVTKFKETFRYCEGLTGSIPEKLFANCPNVTDFTYTFNNCSGLTGNAPSLWNRTNVTSSSGCFTGCANLTNYSSIPDGWK